MLHNFTNDLETALKGSIMCERPPIIEPQILVLNFPKWFQSWLES